MAGTAGPAGRRRGARGCRGAGLQSRGASGLPAASRCPQLRSRCPRRAVRARRRRRRTRTKRRPRTLSGRMRERAVDAVAAAAVASAEEAAAAGPGRGAAAGPGARSPGARSHCGCSSKTRCWSLAPGCCPSTTWGRSSWATCSQTEGSCGRRPGRPSTHPAPGPPTARSW
uniref:MPN domain containing n=1 Tax=Homo sapiens TaxID=9606 RepID=M0R189_HUMAN